VAGLPVVCINASLAVQLPYDPNLEGNVGYGLFNMDISITKINKLNVPVVQLIDLVKEYRPTPSNLTAKAANILSLNNYHSFQSLMLIK
jgi:hypothetical protein